MTFVSVSSEIKKDLECYKNVAKKYCPDVYMEINDYQPKEIGSYPQELVAFIELKKQKKVDYNDQKRFYEQTFIRDFLEEKWEAELYNRNKFLRLYELYSTKEWLLEPIEEKAIDAILVKLNIFYNHSMNNIEPFAALILNWKEYDFPKQQDEWDE